MRDLHNVGKYAARRKRNRIWRSIVTGIAGVVVFCTTYALILPAITLALCLPLAMDTTAVGVSVIMMGMPAASTSAIFAARYHSDAPFATKCVVLSTLLSMLTIPVWCYFIG